MKHDDAAIAVLEPTRHSPLPQSAAPDSLQSPDEGSTSEAVPTVPALDYRQLRLLAECAAGAASAAGKPDEPVRFVFRKTEDTTGAYTMVLECVSASTALLDTDVFIPTRDAGRFVSNQVTLEIAASTEPGGFALPDDLVYDAVFWSDAAVQKFVFPYFASCGGDDAASMLDQLQIAWNFYPTDLQVYALVHAASTAGGQALGMDESFWVVYTEGGSELQAASLATFSQDRLGTERQGTSSGPVRIALGGVGPTAPQPNYESLRAMAEWAAAVNDAPMYFICQPGKEHFEAYTEDEVVWETLDPATIVVPAYTSPVPGDRQTLQGVWFWPQDPDVAPGNVATEGDALFWSSAAIEQFVFPYYASKGGMNPENLYDLERMYRIWNTGETQLGQEVYALIHLPHSEWTEVVEEVHVVKVLEVGGTTSATGPTVLRREVRRVAPSAQLAMVIPPARKNAHPHGNAPGLNDPPHHR